ncbi:MAG: queuosine precursor transporter [Clostridiales Family XIII bacterium]|nr:queuosine precursor transporter [Clostridiales Family XIII bacterium]
MSKQIPTTPAEQKHDAFTPLVVISALLITSYLTANIMAVKLIGTFDVAFLDAGTITFPLAYMLGDVLTEIWGFKTARKVIFLTFFCNIVLVLATAVGVVIPSPEYLNETADAYNTVFTYVPRIVAASLIAFLAGELSNAFFMDKIKKKTSGRFLWLRTIGSSIIGYIFDTVLFCFIAFAGTVRMRDMLVMIGVQYGVKLVIEAVCGTPIAYAVIGYLKKRYGPQDGVLSDDEARGR